MSTKSIFRVKIVMEFDAGADDEQVLQAGVQTMLMPYGLFEPTVSIEPNAEAKASEVRWTADGEHKRLVRKPVTVMSADKLSDMHALTGECALVVKENNTYVFDANIDLAKARGVDFRYVVSCKRGGAWIEVGYLQHQMAAAQQAQQGMVQQMPQRRR